MNTAAISHSRLGNSGLLIVGAMFLCVALAAVGNALAASDPLGPSGQKHIQKQSVVTGSPASQSAPEQRGTAGTPVFVQSIPTAKSADDAAFKEYEHHEKPTLDRWLTYSTVALAAFTLFLFIFTAALWWVTYRLSKQAKATSDAQSTEMGKSIAEAVRSASAMEEVAAATKNNAILMTDILQKQMRAYLAFDSAVFVQQDRSRDYRFEVRFFIKNFGHTSANSINVNYVLTVLESPILESMDLSLPLQDKQDSAAILPGQAYIFTAILDRLLSDEEISEIKETGPRKLFLYGTVKYRDVFENWHYTNFCKFGSWDVKDNFQTVNVQRHNDAT